MRLEEAVQAALDRLQRPGIEGWGLHEYGPQLEKLGDLVHVAPARSCLDDNCDHTLHDPPAPVIRWVPRSGTLIYLGDDGRYNHYYVLRLPDHDLFMHLWAEKSYHARLNVINPSQVPEYLLARLASE